MRTIIMASALVMTGLAGPAMAGGSDNRCAAGPDGRTIAVSEVSRGLESLGYRVDRIKAGRGCYVVQAVNDSGFPIKAVYARTTGELLQAKLR